MSGKPNYMLLVVRMQDLLTDEGCGWTGEHLDEVRRAVANALPADKVQHWLLPYRTVKNPRGIKT